MQSIDPATSEWCWLAFDASTETFANNDPVGTWTNRAVRAGFNMTAAGGVRPTFKTNVLNGYGVLEFDGTDDTMSGGVAADALRMHDGRGFTLITLVKTLDANPDELIALAETGGISSSTVGMFLGFDDRSSVPANNRVLFSVSKGAGSFNYSLTSPDNYMRQQCWTVVTVRANAEVFNSPHHITENVIDCQVMVDGLSCLGVNAANMPFATGNPANAFRIGTCTAVAHFARMQMAGMWIFDEALDDRLLDAYHRWVGERFDVGIQRYVSRRAGYNAFPGLAQLQDGTLLTGYYAGARHHQSGGTGQGGRHAALVQHRSGNGGWDWSLPRVLYASAELEYRDVSFFRTAAGTLLLTTNKSQSIAALDYEPLVLRATDGAGYTWSSELVLNHGMTEYAAVHGGWCQLPGGTIFLPLFGRNTGDAANTYRALAVKSTDDGATWGSPVTLGNGSADAKTYSEGTIARRASGTLQAIFRNDTDSTYMTCTSTDDGVTWSALTTLITGVSSFPCLLQAQSGNWFLFCRSSTAPNRGIVLRSADEGATWTSVAGAYHMDPVPGFFTYAAALEIRAGRFLVVYSSETAAFSSNPTQSVVRSRVIREDDLLNFS